MKSTLIFEEPSCLETFSSSNRDIAQYLFKFTVIDSSLIGEPEEFSKTFRSKIIVGITLELNRNWQLKDKDNELIKVLFEYGKRHVIQKLKDGTLSEREEIFLTTSNSPENCPFDPSRIINPRYVKFEVDISKEKIMQKTEFLQLAASIIDTRDNINAVFNQKYKEKLLELTEERDILQFFRDASSQEEFLYRLCALKNVATNFNINILRKITGVNDASIGSIGLIEKYLKQNVNFDESIIKTLKYLNRFRQCYPIHGDRVEGVLGAHEYFRLDYPVVDFSNAWKNLLLSYLDALKRLFEIIK